MLLAPLCYRLRISTGHMPTFVPWFPLVIACEFLNHIPTRARLQHDERTRCRSHRSSGRSLAQLAVRNVFLRVRRRELHAVALGEGTFCFSIQRHTLQAAWIVNGLGMVPAEGIEPRPVIENTEVADSTNAKNDRICKNADNWNVSGTQVFEGAAVAKRIPRTPMMVNVALPPAIP
jgi:hypothetical protein